MGNGRRNLIITLNVVLFWIVVPGALYMLGRLADRLPLLAGFPDYLRWTGLPFALGGAWLCLHAILLLRIKGRGLPISSLPPTRFVISGPYRYFRHPIYTGFTFLAFGVGLLVKSPGMSLIVVPLVTLIWFLTWVKLYEEPGLLQRFGSSYRAHRDRSPIFFPLGGKRMLRALVHLVFRLKFKIRVKGRENVPAEGPLLMISDHLSYLDFMFAQIGSPRPLLIPVTAEVFRKPLPRAFLGFMGGVPKRRFGADPAAALALSDQLQAGGVVGIAVEGERSWTGEMSPIAPNVARSISRFPFPIVPVAFIGSYKVWPRWAGGRKPKAVVTINIGKPFRLDKEIEGFQPGDSRQAGLVSQVLGDKINALRDEDESAVDLSDYPSPRPELTLWRCPVCGAEECLSMQERRWLLCRECGARWDGSGGDLTLIEPVERAGERATLAHWAAMAGGVGALAEGGEAIIEAETVEFREEPHARALLAPLHVLGSGKAALYRDHIEWRGGEEHRRLLLSLVHTVTTERNDTLQLGFSQGVAQLVFDKASPLRWQLYVLACKDGCKAAPLDSVRRQSGNKEVEDVR